MPYQTPAEQSIINQMRKLPYVAVRGHGSPHDRGSADAYYGRQPRPHKRDGATTLPLTHPEEYSAYYHGYATEEYRKDWS